MTSTLIIARGKRFIVIVVHPEQEKYEVSCPTLESAQQAAANIRDGRYHF